MSFNLFKSLNPLNAITKNVGDTVTLKTTPTTGTAPFTVYWLKDGIQFAPPQTNVQLNQIVLTTYVVTSNDSGSTITFGSYTIDSCVSNPQTSPTVNSTVSVASCTNPICSFGLE